MSYLRNFAKRAIGRAGFELRRVTPSSSPAFQLTRALHRFDIDLVLDVGANVGQFAREIRAAGYSRKIVSFEPLSKANLALSRAAEADELWRVHSRGALGDYDGTTEINISENSVSSSLLPMLEAHSSAAGRSAYVGKEMVRICRLDSVAPQYLEQSRRPFLKVDAQGGEWRILDGAGATLLHLHGILCELSLVPLYEGQHLWMEMIRRLEGEGFTLWAIQSGFTDPRDGRTLQVNAIFFRL